MGLQLETNLKPPSAMLLPPTPSSANRQEMIKQTNLRINERQKGIAAGKSDGQGEMPAGGDVLKMWGRRTGGFCCAFSQG